MVLTTCPVVQGEMGLKKDLTADIVVFIATDLSVSTYLNPYLKMCVFQNFQVLAVFPAL